MFVVLFIANDEEEKIEVHGILQILEGERKDEVKKEEKATRLMNLDTLKVKEESKKQLSQLINKLKKTVLDIPPHLIIDKMLKHADQNIDLFLEINNLNSINYVVSIINGLLNTCLQFKNILNALNSTYKNGMTQLMNALENDKPDAASLLLKYEQVDVSIRDVKGNNVLFYISKKYPKKSKNRIYVKLFGTVLHHKTFNAKMLRQPNKNGESIIKDVANKDLIVLLLLIGQSMIYFGFIVILSLNSFFSLMISEIYCG